MDEHTSGLVYYDQFVVFVNNIEWYFLREHRRFPFRFQLDLDKVSLANAFSLILDPSVDLALSALNYLAKVHPAKSVKSSKEIFFEP